MIIYKVTNLINGKCYIGKTIYSLQHRMKEHLYHINQSTSPCFYNALKKHGCENFEWEVLEKCEDEKELNEMEYHFIVQYESCYKENGYNLSFGGEGNSGYKFTEEQRVRLSNAHKGKIFTEEHKRNLSEACLGRKLSLEVRKKIRNRNKGENNGMYGKKHSKESRKKMSEKAKERTGEKHPNYGKKGKSNPSYDRKNKEGIWILELPDGAVEQWHNLSSFVRDYESRFNIKLCESNLHHVKRGRIKQYRGIKCKFIYYKNITASWQD